jgi:hypothetical protein
MVRALLIEGFSWAVFLRANSATYAMWGNDRP